MLNIPGMIIACPACATRYVVPDSAIGVEGRTVRCAKCKHSWYQQGAEMEAPAEQVTAPPPPSAPPPAPAPQPEAAPAPRVAEPVVPQPAVPQPAVAEPAYAGRGYEDEVAVAPPPPLPEDVPPPPPVYGREPEVEDYQEDRSSFEHQPPFRPRRNRARMWTVAAVLFAVISLAGIGAVALNGLPDWVPLARTTFAQPQPDLVLDFPPNRQDRRTLPNGTEYFGASGTVTNIGGTRRDVPSILIVLRDGRERIVYSWEVAPPKRQLAPGESITINEAVTDVPRTAKFAEIGWKPG
jgi:predicted Zn finger-like uncharacterized protein